MAHPRPRPRNRRRRGPSSITIKIAAWKRRALRIAITVVVVGLVLIAWSLRVKDKPQAAAVSPAHKSQEEKVDNLELARSGAAAAAAVDRVVKAQDETTFVNGLRVSQRSPERWQQWQKIIKEEGGVSHTHWMAPLRVGDAQAEQYLVFFRSGTNRIFTAVESGEEWLVDWDGFARTAVPVWPELLAGGPREAVVRVYVAADRYYQGEFQDEAAWQCLGLASPDCDELMFGYVKKDSEMAKRLDMLLEQKSPQRVTLRVRGPVSTTLKQFEVLELLSESWVLPE